MSASRNRQVKREQLTEAEYARLSELFDLTRKLKLRLAAKAVVKDNAEAGFHR